MMVIRNLKIKLGIRSIKFWNEFIFIYGFEIHGFYNAGGNSILNTQKG